MTTYSLRGYNDAQFTGESGRRARLAYCCRWNEELAHLSHDQILAALELKNLTPDAYTTAVSLFPQLVQLRLLKSEELCSGSEQGLTTPPRPKSGIHFLSYTKAALINAALVP
jgi:hypothetical protein